MMILALLMAAALAGADDPATAPTQAASPPAERVPVSAPLKPGEKRIKMICMTDTRPASRLTERNCYPAEEWKARQERARDVVSDYQMAPQMNPGH